MRKVSQDGTIELLVQFTNGDGDPIDPDSGPVLSIFDPSSPPADPLTVDADATVLNATEASLGDGSQVGQNMIIKVSTGLYSYSYTLDIDATVGSWYDRWEATVDGLPLETVFSFDVTEVVTIESVSLSNNQLITIILDESIADSTGDILTGGHEIFFSTVYTPYYASSDILNLEIGSYISGIPEFTLNFAIHWASVQADACTFNKRFSGGRVSGSMINKEYLEYARTQFVLCQASLFLISNATSSNIKSKTLGDLEVEYDSSVFSVISELKDMCKEWKRVLNSGGKISEGSSLMPVTGTKGSARIDRPLFGRDWIKLSNTRGGANSKSRIGDRGVRHWSTDAVQIGPHSHNHNQDPDD
jgi:hypothetical protein